MDSSAKKEDSGFPHISNTKYLVVEEDRSVDFDDEYVTIYYDKEFVEKISKVKELKPRLKYLTHAAALDYIKSTDKDCFDFEEPETIADLNHMDAVLKDREFDKVVIQANSSEVLNKPLLDFVVKKCMEEDTNNISIRLNPRLCFETDTMSITGASNDFCCQMTSAKNTLFGPFIYCVKSLKNRKMHVELLMETDFEKLTKHLNWPPIDKAGWKNPKKGYYYMNLSVENDSNTYRLINDREYYENQFTDCEHTQLSSSNEDLTFDRGSFYAVNVETAAVASFYLPADGASATSGSNLLRNTEAPNVTGYGSIHKA